MKKIAAILCLAMVFSTAAVSGGISKAAYGGEGGTAAVSDVPVTTEGTDGSEFINIDGEDEQEVTSAVTEEEDETEQWETGNVLDINEEEYGIALLAEEGETVGSFTVYGGTEGTNYIYENNVLTILSGEITISGSTTTDRIVVTGGANITLSGVSITSSNAAAFEIATGSGDVTVTLVGENNLESGGLHAGLQKTEDNCKLTINAQGNLTAQGGQDGGAGIGGIGVDTVNGIAGNGKSIKIILDGGTVNATGGGNGAGIGGGGGKGNNDSKAGHGDIITITGNGKVNATGGGYGAGIGGGGNGNAYAGNGTNIKIDLDGGEVSAVCNGSGGGYGAGIGGGGAQYNKDGETGCGKNISISGSGKVIAKGGSNSMTLMTGAAIGGGGNGGDSTDITITGSVTVEAIGGIIGGGTGWGINGNGGKVTIDENFSGTVTAGTIGGLNSEVTISGGDNITATGTIGGSNSTVKIDENFSGTVNAGTTGGYNSNVTINGNGTVISKYIGGDGNNSSVKINGKDKDNYPWVETDKITRTNKDEYDTCVVFDKNYKNNYATDLTDAEVNKVKAEYSNDITKETIRNTRQNHRPDGVVYGDISLEKLEEPYVLGYGKTLTVHEGGSLKTGENLTLADGSVLYLEAGATLDKYSDVGGYDEDNVPGDVSKRKILHESEAADNSDNTCPICGSDVPHHWGTEWENDDTYHWHVCLTEECSVFAAEGECSIPKTERFGHGKHKFGEPITHNDTDIMYQLCEDCKYERAFAVQLNKLDNKNKALEGAEFGLFSEPDSETPITTATSDESGKVAFTERIALNNTYYIKEITAPENFVVSDEVFKVVTSDEAADPVVIYSTVVRDASGNATATVTSSENVPKNTSCYLYTDDRYTNYVTGYPRAVFDENGNVSLSNNEIFEKGNTYYFYYSRSVNGSYTTTYFKMEITAAANVAYSTGVPDTDGKITFTAANGIPTCVNTLSAAEVVIQPIQLIKKDGEGKALAGAEFGLYSNSSCTDKIGNGTSGDNGTVTFAADEGKEIEADKTYYIKEITAPDGYTASDDVFRVNVGADGTVTYGADNSENIPVCVNEIIPDPITPDPIKIRKTDGEGTALAGAVFGLYSNASCTEKVGSGTSGADGTVTFAADTGKAIEADKTYYIKEITAPNGYTASDDVFRVNVGADGKVTYGENNSTVIPECVNEIIPDPITPDPIKLRKTDGEGKALAGAVFGLYSDSGCNTPVEGNIRATSDASGNVSFTEGFELGNTYYIKEITAPDGYTASDKAFRAVVGADGKVTYGADNSEDIPVCKNEKTTSPSETTVTTPSETTVTTPSETTVTTPSETTVTTPSETTVTTPSETTVTTPSETTVTTPSETTVTIPSETTVTTPSETTVTTPEVTTAPAPVVTGGGDIPVLPNVTRPVVIVEQVPDVYPDDDDGGEDVAAGAEVRDNIIYGDGYTITAMVIVRLVLAGAALTFLLWRCTKI